MPRTAPPALALALVAAVAVWTAPSVASAQIQVRGPQVYPGKSEVSAHIGVQNGLASYNFGGGPPGGFRLLGDYSFRFVDNGAYTLWLNVGFALTVGGGCNTRINSGGFGNIYGCGGYATGNSIEPLVGVKLKFRTPIPLVPYARLDALFGYVFNRYCGDDGFAFGGRAAGGAKYFLTRNIGVGIETGLTLGGARYNGAPVTNNECFANNYFYPAHAEFYGAFDFLLGAEFAFNNI